MVNEQCLSFFLNFTSVVPLADSVVGGSCQAVGEDVLLTLYLGSKVYGNPKCPFIEETYFY